MNKSYRLKRRKDGKARHAFHKTDLLLWESTVELNHRSDCPQWSSKLVMVAN